MYPRATRFEIVGKDLFRKVPKMMPRKRFLRTPTPGNISGCPTLRRYCIRQSIMALVALPPRIHPITADRPPSPHVNPHRYLEQNLRRIANWFSVPYRMVCQQEAELIFAGTAPYRGDEFTLTTEIPRIPDARQSRNRAVPQPEPADVRPTNDMSVRTAQFREKMLAYKYPCTDRRATCPAYVCGRQQRPVAPVHSGCCKISSTASSRYGIFEVSTNPANPHQSTPRGSVSRSTSKEGSVERRRGNRQSESPFFRTSACFNTEFPSGETRKPQYELE